MHGIILVCAALILTKCSAYRIPPYGLDSDDLCFPRSRSCHMQLQIREFGGALLHNITTDSCECHGARRCQTVSGDSRFVIHRNLISTVHNMTLSMVFCHPIPYRDLCREGQIAFEVSGHSVIPQDFEHYHCRCRNDGPLQLRDTFVDDEYRRHEQYICEDFQAFCPTRFSPCVVINETMATGHYGCRCPPPTQCRILNSLPNAKGGVYGFCRQ